MSKKKKKEKKKEYKSAYQEQLDSTLDSILNNDPFSWNMNADSMYNMYKNMYMSRGNYDMQNAIGEGAALTGGIASSAAVAAGNSAYQAQMSQLNDRVPELYQDALNSYNQNMSNMQTQYGILQSADNTAYQRYRDGIADKYSDKNFKLQKEGLDLQKDKYGLK